MMKEIVIGKHYRVSSPGTIYNGQIVRVTRRDKHGVVGRATSLEWVLWFYPSELEEVSEGECSS